MASVSAAMTGAALIALAVLIPQDVPRAPAAPAPAPYEAPVVRPFEPPDDFAAPPAQGSEAAAMGRRPLERPVRVEAYRGDYETPSELDQAYARGVDQAERVMDGRMGPLDGRWRVVDGAGRLAYDLLLSDPPAPAPLEGAWRADRRTGVAASGAREPGAPVLLVLDGHCALRLAVTAGGIEAVMIRDGREERVRLIRP